ncbi:MAG: hypothetical protein GY830_06235 [Bacteroidetes bacterium]|nr:hypothetical protein [Bacteroidota bacterium]
MSFNKNSIKLKTYIKHFFYMLLTIIAFACKSNENNSENSRVEQRQERSTVEVKNRKAGYDHEHRHSLSTRNNSKEILASSEYHEHVKDIFQKAMENFRKGMDLIEKTQRKYDNLHRFPFLTPDKNAFQNFKMQQLKYPIRKRVKKFGKTIDYLKNQHQAEKAMNDVKEAAGDIHNHPFRVLRLNEKSLEHQAHIINNIPAKRKKARRKFYREFKKQLQEHITWQEKIVNLKEKNPHIAGAYIYGLLDPHQTMSSNSSNKVGIDKHHYNAPLTRGFGFKLRKILIPHGVTKLSKLTEPQRIEVNRQTAKMDKLSNEICRIIKEHSQKNSKKKKKREKRRRDQAVHDEEKEVARRVDKNVHNHLANKARDKMEREVNHLETRIQFLTKQAVNKAKNISESHKTTKEKIKAIEDLRKKKMQSITTIIKNSVDRIKEDPVVEHSLHENQIIREMRMKIKTEIRDTYVKKMQDKLQGIIKSLEKHKAHKNPILHKLNDKLKKIFKKHKRHLKKKHREHVNHVHDLHNEHNDKIKKSEDRIHRKRIHDDIQHRIDKHHHEQLHDIQQHQQKQLDEMKKQLAYAIDEIKKLKGKSDDDKETMIDKAKDLHDKHNHNLRAMTELHKDHLRESVDQAKSDIRHDHDEREESEDKYDRALLDKEYDEENEE